MADKDTKDVCREIRARLKEKFPQFKFHVYFIRYKRDKDMIAADFRGYLGYEMAQTWKKPLADSCQDIVENNPEITFFFC
jgi:hypothetical protein